VTHYKVRAPARPRQQRPAVNPEFTPIVLQEALPGPTPEWLHQREVGCLVKVAHMSQASAEIAADKMREREDGKRLIRVYACPFAATERPHWHIGGRRVSY